MQRAAESNARRGGCKEPRLWGAPAGFKRVFSFLAKKQRAEWACLEKAA